MYLLLPTVIMAWQVDREERMWLRLEDKLSVYGPRCMYALKHNDRVVRLEPGYCRPEDSEMALWCLSQSVVRGEYKGLQMTFKGSRIHSVRTSR